jgi:hypothetical protein
VSLPHPASACYPATPPRTSLTACASQQARACQLHGHLPDPTPTLHQQAHTQPCQLPAIVPSLQQPAAEAVCLTQQAATRAHTQPALPYQASQFVSPPNSAAQPIQLAPEGTQLPTAGHRAAQSKMLKQLNGAHCTPGEKLGTANPTASTGAAALAAPGAALCPSDDEALAKHVKNVDVDAVSTPGLEGAVQHWGRQQGCASMGSPLVRPLLSPQLPAGSHEECVVCNAVHARSLQDLSQSPVLLALHADDDTPHKAQQLLPSPQPFSGSLAERTAAAHMMQHLLPLPVHLASPADARTPKKEPLRSPQPPAGSLAERIACNSAILHAALDVEMSSEIELVASEAGTVQPQQQQQQRRKVPGAPASQDLLASATDDGCQPLLPGSCKRRLNVNAPGDAAAKGSYQATQVPCRTKAKDRYEARALNSGVQRQLFPTESIADSPGTSNQCSPILGGQHAPDSPDIARAGGTQAQADCVAVLVHPHDGYGSSPVTGSCVRTAQSERGCLMARADTVNADNDGALRAPTQPRARTKAERMAQAHRSPMTALPTRTSLAGSVRPPGGQTMEFGLRGHTKAECMQQAAAHTPEAATAAVAGGECQARQGTADAGERMQIGPSLASRRCGAGLTREPGGPADVVDSPLHGEGGPASPMATGAVAQAAACASKAVGVRLRAKEEAHMVVKRVRGCEAGKSDHECVDLISSPQAGVQASSGKTQRLFEVIDLC